jgi:hypothetical protein
MNRFLRQVFKNGENKYFIVFFSPKSPLKDVPFTPLFVSICFILATFTQKSMGLAKWT